MKKVLIGLTLLASMSSFAGECTVSISKGKNFPDFVEKSVGFSELVKAQEQNLLDRGYILVEGDDADQEVKVGLVTEINGPGGFWALHRADAYTSYVIGRGRDIDVTKTPSWFGTTTPTELIEGVLEKAVNALPDC